METDDWWNYLDAHWGALIDTFSCVYGDAAIEHLTTLQRAKVMRQTTVAQGVLRRCLLDCPPNYRLLVGHHALTRLSGTITKD